jgi:hypothetical protein
MVCGSLVLAGHIIKPGLKESGFELLEGVSRGFAVFDQAVHLKPGFCQPPRLQRLVSRIG